MKTTPNALIAMKTLLHLLTLVFLIPCAHAQIAPNGIPWTNETATRLITGFDVNSDTSTDAIIVDKAQGTFTVGIRNVDSTYTWSAPRSLGFAPVEAMAAGRFITSSANAIAVTSKNFNNVQFAPVNGDDLPPVKAVGQPEPLTLAGIKTAAGPHGIAVGVTPDAAFSPSLIATSVDTFYGNLWSSEDLGSAPHHANAIHANATAAPVLGFVVDSGAGTSEVQIFSASDTSGTLLASMTGLPASARFMHGFYTADMAPQSFGYQSTTLIAWSPTGQNLYTQRLTDVIWPTTALPGLTLLEGTQHTFNMSRTVKAVYNLLRPGTSQRLLIQWGDVAGGATIYDFDGTTAPVLVEELDLNGLTLDGIVPLVNSGDFLALGTRGGEPAYDTFSDNGSPGHYTSRGTGTLPSMSAAPLYSNVIAFNGEPFVNPNASELKRSKVRDWTTTATQASGSASITGLLDTAPTTGLSTPAAQALDLPPATTHLLLNQIDANSSFRLRSAKSTDQASLPYLTFSPPSGFYPAPTTEKPFIVKISVTGGYTYQYRVGNGPWQFGNSSTEITLESNTTLRAFGMGFEGAAFGPISSAIYTFGTLAPVAVQPTLDSNQNGLSDAWENLTGLSDPAADSDGDGFLNLQEHNFGSDPTLNGSNPGPIAIAMPGLAMNSTTPGNTANTLNWETSDNAVILEGSDDLTTWTTVNTGITANGNQRSYTMPVNVFPKRFYRLRR